MLLTSSAVEQPSVAQAIDVLLAFETAPGSQTGSGYIVNLVFVLVTKLRCVVEVS